MQPLLDTIASNGPAVIVLAALVGAGAFVVITGRARGQKQVADVQGDSAPATIKAAIDNLTETNLRLEAAKREELSAIKDMGAILAASNRIAVEQQAGGAKVLETLQSIERSCVEHVTLQRQTATETRGLSDKLDELAREIIRLRR